jgi:hypothetical protein
LVFLRQARHIACIVMFFGGCVMDAWSHSREGLAVRLIFDDSTRHLNYDRELTQEEAGTYIDDQSEDALSLP